jgi:hypothetical protein
MNVNKVHARDGSRSAGWEPAVSRIVHPQAAHGANAFATAPMGHRQILPQPELRPHPIQFQSGLNPTQSNLIRPNPTYDKKINPRNRVKRLVK